MLSTRKKWLIGAAVVAAAGITGVFVAASVLAKRFEPYIRQQAIDYLSKRFDSEVEVGSLKVNIPRIPLLQLASNRGRGTVAQVVGENIVLRHRGRRDIPPMFAMKKFHFNVDLGRVFDPLKKVALVQIDSMEIHVPPKGERPRLSAQKEAPVEPKPREEANQSLSSQVLIEQVVIADSRLVILPRQKDRQPLVFELHNVVLNAVQLNEPLKYRAKLTNPKPPGLIESAGTFGPWNSDTPGDTPLTGDYTFENADLSVFRSIAGILNSKGSFVGTLNAVSAKGVADVPDFRLTSSGNPMPLHTEYETLVDGTNGNTVLKPVRARLKTTNFTTSGAVLKHEGVSRRSIDLDVTMPDGEMRDLLQLAMKGSPVMAGRIRMSAKIRIPPLSGKVIEKLLLDGKFAVRQGQFLREGIQDKIDTLSRRGQGKPKSQEISDVFSDMAGDFHLANSAISFKSLTFGVPGSRVDLAGQYDIAGDALDFKGTLRLDAKVSQTMTGWKRVVLKPVDPFLSRDGAGTLLKIKVTGTSKEPKFGGSM